MATKLPGRGAKFTQQSALDACTIFPFQRQKSDVILEALLLLFVAVITVGGFVIDDCVSHPCTEQYRNAETARPCSGLPRSGSHFVLARPPLFGQNSIAHGVRSSESAMKDYARESAVLAGLFRLVLPISHTILCHETASFET